MVRKSIIFESPKFDPKIEEGDFEAVDPEELFDDELDSLRED